MSPRDEAIARDTLGGSALLGDDIVLMLLSELPNPRDDNRCVFGNGVVDNELS